MLTEITCVFHTGPATEKYRSLPFEKMNGKEDNRDACLSFNYLCPGRKHGMMYAFLTFSREQPCGCEFREVPEGLYMKISLSDSTAEALGKAPWHGGITPCEWGAEQIAPAPGYAAGDCELPILVYYGFFNMTTFEHDYRCLHVPVKKVG